VLYNKEHRKEYYRKWRAKDPEKKRETNREAQRKYRAKDPEKVKEYYRKWRAKDPEKKRETNREAQRKYRAKDPEKVREANTLINRIWRAKNPEKARASVRKWEVANPEKKRAAVRKWQVENPEKARASARKWKVENPEKVRRLRRKWKKYKRGTDPNWKLTENMRSAMYNALKGRSKSAPTMKIIGCTSEELWEHLESCSTWEPWMIRENYGVGGWDVDHIIAISKWDYDCPLQFALCWDKSNLQPMEHIENIKKGAKTISEDITSPKM